ncbi:hypothetical protein EON62_01540 [archaeon]|nr:MAG: hypothetical protein EON62_01540 [archaeon]
MVIAPLSANTLAKVAAGLCDNLLTCVLRAWDFDGGKPILVAPAMNTHMWTHPFTAKHLAVLQELGMHVIPPIAKRLACGDVGHGAMAPVEDIVEAVVSTLYTRKALPSTSCHDGRAPPPAADEADA